MDELEKIRTSPFRYIPGMKMVLNNKNTRCSSLALKKDFAKGYLNDEDMVIIETIYTFDILNKNALTFFIMNNRDIADNVKKTDYTKNLRKLVDRGVLLSFSFCADNYESPHVYTLSNGARQYFGGVFGRSFKLKHRDSLFETSIDTVAALRAVAFNQFYLRLYLAQEEVGFERLLADFSLKYKGSKLFLDGLMNITNMEGIKKEFAFLCIRNGNNMMEVFNAHMEALVHHRKEPVVVVLVESMAVAQNLEKFRITRERLKGLTVLYLPDVVAVSTSPLTCLYSLAVSKDYTLFKEYGLKELL